MRHQHEVPGLIPVVVDGVVVDVAEDGVRPQSVGAILAVDELAHPVHDVRASLLGRRDFAVSLLDHLGVELEVDVLDPLQVDAAQVSGGGGGLGLEQLLGALQDGDHAGFVFETVHVLVGVGVTAFQNLDELLSHALNHGQEAAANLKNKVKHIQFKLRVAINFHNCHYKH